MPSVKILHCADLHIGAAVSFLGARAVSRRAETLITFERIINLAAKQGVEIILIAGDLLDSNSIEDGVFGAVLKCISSVPQIKVVFSAGNHDPLSADSPFKKARLPENLYVLDTKDSFVQFDELKTRVYGKSFGEVYMQGCDSFSLNPSEDFINLMCILGELRSDLGSDYNSITPAFLEGCGMDYVALGHVHKRSDIAKIGGSHCAYCGCAEGQGFDELGQKGVYLGEVSKQGCNLQFVPTAKRLHLSEKVDIGGAADSAEAADKVITFLKEKYENFSENLYKIALTGTVDEGAALSTEEIASRLSEQVYFAKVKDKTELAIDLEAIAQENSLKGIFVKKMLARINDAAPEQKETLLSALNLGLKAFLKEVAYDED